MTTKIPKICYSSSSPPLIHLIIIKRSSLHKLEIKIRIPSTKAKGDQMQHNTAYKAPIK